MYNAQNNGLPGVVDSDGFCFRYVDKNVIQNEEYLYSNYWREQINTYGTLVTYYVNAYNILNADNFYGEQPTQKYAEGRNVVMAIDLAENATALSKFGFQADDEITAYIHLSTFYDVFYNVNMEILTNEYLSNPSLSAKLQEEQDWFGFRTEEADTFETQYNQVQPKAGDVFTLTEYGYGRPGPRSGYNYEVTQILDQDIARTNQLGGHYVWIIKAKRLDYSFEPGLSAEKGGDQVYDNSYSGVLSSAVNNDITQPKKYNEQDNLQSIDNISSTIVFNMTANNNTDVYGGY